MEPRILWDHTDLMVQEDYGLHIHLLKPVTIYFKAFYPGQHIEETVPGFFGPPTVYNITYLTSESDTFTLIVQTDPIPTYPMLPLPTEYWTRPIYATNYNWAALGGSWYGLATPAFATTGDYDATGNFQQYSTAPNTGHIMWTKPTHFGGQVGAPISADQMSQYMSTTIATNFFEPIILNGVLYYTEYAGPNAAKASWVAPVFARVKHYGLGVRENQEAKLFVWVKYYGGIQFRNMDLGLSCMRVPQPGFSVLQLTSQSTMLTLGNTWQTSSTFKIYPF